MQLNPKVAPGLEGVVEKLLDKDVDLRYQHASELRADLKRMRRDTDSGHRPPAASLGGCGTMECPEGDRRGRPWCPRARSRGVVGEELRRPGTSRDERAGADDQPADRYGGALVVRQLVPRRYPGCLRLHPERVDGRRRHVARGGEPRLVAGGPNDEAMPRWSPDGSRIAFLSDDGTGMNVYWVPPTGGARRRIAQTHLQYLDRFTSIGAVGSQPWSPDGRRLVFSRLEPTHSVALWTVDIESGQEARLTAPPAGASDWRAAWSHDGKWIAFSRSSTGSSSNLYLVPASGGEPRAVLPDETVTRGSATWSLDDHRLLFVVPAGTFGGDVSEVEIGTGRIRQLTVGARVEYPDPLLHRAHRFLAMEP